MSTSPSKNSSKRAPRGSRPPSQQGAGIGPSDDRNASMEKPGEPQSSKVNENPEGPKTDKVSSEGTGGKKVFKPKELKICWQEETKFWSIPEGDGLPVELLEVCWLDVSGEMPVTKGKAYEVSFMLSMNTKHSFGWELPVTVMARIGKEGKYERKEIDLSKLSEEVKEFPPDKCRIEFKNEKSGSNETLYFGLYEVWTNKWKGGLRIHEAIVQEIPASNIPAQREGNSSS